jgi:hypothetical protein
MKQNISLKAVNKKMQFLLAFLAKNKKEDSFK